MEAFQRELCTPLELKAETSGPWLFATTSVWNVAGGDLDATLARLACPTLRTTTVDGALWELRLGAPDRDPEALNHHFNLLSSDMAEELECYEDVQQLVEDGWLDEAQAAGLAGLSPAEAVAKHTADNNDAILSAVASMGLPGDADALRAILEGETVSREELGWDVGNLPRFLSALGLDGPFGDWRQELEEERQERQEREREAEARPPDDMVAPLELALQGLEPADLTGGPVAATLKHAVMVAWSCNRGVEAAVRIRLLPGAVLEVDRAAYPDVEFVEAPGSLRLGTHDCSSRSACVNFCAALQPLVEALPDGARLDLLCAERPTDPMGAQGFDLDMLPDELREKVEGFDPDEAVNPAGNQIYSGEVHGGVWQISACHPAVSAEDLSAACALFAAAREPLPVSDAEAAAVTEAASQDVFMEGVAVVHQDGAVSVEEAHRYLAALVFRQRFRHVWDVERAEADDLAEWKEYIDDDVFGDFAADEPERGEVLLNGSWSTFFRTEMVGWQGLSEDDVAAMDGKMKALGLEPLGDLVAEAAGPIVLRGYGAARATLHATWMVGAFNTRVIDLFTTFEEGGSLTTTTNPMAFPDEAAGVYKDSHPNLAPDALQERHDRRLKELAAQGRTPAEAEPDLLALARSIDEFMA